MLPPWSLRWKTLTHIASLRPYQIISHQTRKNIYWRLIFPRTAPKVIIAAPAAKSPTMRCSISILIFYSSSPLVTWCQNPVERTPHWRAHAEMIQLKARADQDEVLTKVIKKPKPMKIITWTSWKTA